MRLSEKQTMMLSMIARHGENASAESGMEFESGLWFRNRERVIDSLKRRELINDEWELTDSGKIELARNGSD